MKYFTIIPILVLLCSCASSPKYSGQRYESERPFFYMSLAPSFSKPFEYEVQGNTLIYREYSGKGGYNWGTRKVVAKKEISREEKNKLDQLTLQAIEDTINIEQERNKTGELVVVMDGTNWFIQSGIVPLLSIRTNNIESSAYNKIKNLLDSILGREK